MLPQRTIRVGIQREGRVRERIMLRWVSVRWGIWVGRMGEVLGGDLEEHIAELEDDDGEGVVRGCEVKVYVHAGDFGAADCCAVLLWSQSVTFVSAVKDQSRPCRRSSTGSRSWAQGTSLSS